MAGTKHATQNAPHQLHEYRRKRDPGSTPEPFGTEPSDSAGLFVIQKHAARALHYDLRLEMGGVLKSWAVPRGPSIQPHEKRLAVHVEDHPVEYAEFEGVIPAGNYGAGAVIVWDSGCYKLRDGAEGLAALEKGRLEFELYGYKLRGWWILVRTHRGGKDWLLFSKSTPADAREPTEHQPESILSGLTVEERSAPERRRAQVIRKAEAFGAVPGEVPPQKQRFMLAASGQKVFTSKDWLFEIKYDGVRVFAYRRDDDIVLYSRNGRIVSRRYPEIVYALGKTAATRFLIDGEIIAPDENGRPSFQRLQRRMHLADGFDRMRLKRLVPVQAIFFDCLALEGLDLRTLPLWQRKECLKTFLPPKGPLQFCEHIAERGEDVYRAARENDLEGIIGKRAASRYPGGRTQDWLKFKCQRRQEFVIGGYTSPGGLRAHFGALHLGLYEGGRLAYVSKVGTGFDQKALASLGARLRVLERQTCPFASGAPSGAVHHWVEPELVCEVRFTEWTHDGGLRHPSFLGLREDKNARECVREALPDLDTIGNEPAGAAFEVSNPGKVFWPADGYTKGDLIAYYDAVAPLLLPYLAERPVVLTRFPDGIAGKSFFQKDAPEFVPDWITTRAIYSRDTRRNIRYFIIDDREALRYVINLGTIPLHVWASRLASLDRPDWLVLDLDPKGAPFSAVVSVARALKRILDELELVSYVKTSGATGLHLMLPMGWRYSYEECRHFARLLAMLGERAMPETATIARPLRSRAGKVYIDFGQNGHGRTIASPFAVRPLPGAPVSCPLRWSEVTSRLDPKRYTIATVPKRFRQRRDPLLPVLGQGIDMAQALQRVEALLRKR